MSIICTAEASGSLSGCTVRTEGNKEDKVFELLGRESMFAKVTDFAYASLDARVQIASGAGRRFALAGAKCERRLPARYGTAPEVSSHGRITPTGQGSRLRDVRAAEAYESA